MLVSGPLLSFAAAEEEAGRYASLEEEEAGGVWAMMTTYHDRSVDHYPC